MIKKFLDYLKFERNYSPDTIEDYDADLDSQHKDNIIGDEEVLLNDTALTTETTDVQKEDNTNNTESSSQSDVISVLLSNGAIIKSQLNYIP